MQNVGKALAVVAHPDDCIIFALPFIAHYKNLNWHIVYLTYNYNDPRAKEVKEFWNKRQVSTEFLGFIDDHHDNEYKKLMRWSQQDVDHSIEKIATNFELILTHNKDGDYGHIHHIAVYNSIMQYSLNNIPKVFFASTFNCNSEIACGHNYYSLDELPLHKEIVEGFNDRLIGRYVITNEAEKFLGKFNEST